MKTTQEARPVRFHEPARIRRTISAAIGDATIWHRATDVATGERVLIKVTALHTPLVVGLAYVRANRQSSREGLAVGGWIVDP